MIHPSYNELISAVNQEASQDGEHPVIKSRYSIVIATAKRARQLVAGAEPLAEASSNKPLSIAVEELCQGKVRILGEDDEKTE